MQTSSTFGPYKLFRRVAIGGMAEIFLARRDDEDRWFALKIMLPHNAGNPEHELMFMDEAQLLQRVRHPNIVAAMDVLHVDGRIAVALEYIPGNDLSVVLKRMRERNTVMPLDLALEIAMGIAAGLHHAHTLLGPDGAPLYLVHRDVTPENILLGVDGSVKIADFGVAKARGFNQVETKTGIIKGKLRYMAPEYATGNMQDVRSDLFSLGLCAFEMITGEHAYERAGLGPELVDAIKYAQVPKLETLREGCPPLLQKLLDKMLAVNPLDRFTTAESLRRALEKVHGTLPPSGVSLAPFLRGLGLAPSMPIVGGEVKLSSDESSDRATTLEPTGQMPLSVNRIPVAEAKPEVLSVSGYHRIVRRQVVQEPKAAAVVQHHHPSALSGLIDLNVYVESVDMEPLGDADSGEAQADESNEGFDSTPTARLADFDPPPEPASGDAVSPPVVSLFDDLFEGDAVALSLPAAQPDEVTGDHDTQDFEDTGRLDAADWDSTGRLDATGPTHALARTDTRGAEHAPVERMVTQPQRIVTEPLPVMPATNAETPQNPIVGPAVVPMQAQPDHPVTQPLLAEHEPEPTRPSAVIAAAEDLRAAAPTKPEALRPASPPLNPNMMMPSQGPPTGQMQRPFASNSGIFATPQAPFGPPPQTASTGIPTGEPSIEASLAFTPKPTIIDPDSPLAKMQPMKLRTEEPEEEEPVKPKYSPLFVKYGFMGIAILVVLAMLGLIWALT
ncbi:MAG: protein kinase [bacterium]